MAKREFSKIQYIKMYLEVAVVLPVIYMISFLCPYEKIHSVSKMLGRIVVKLFPDKKINLKKNLTIMFPDRSYSEKELKDLADAANGYECRLILEMMAFMRMGFQDLLSYVRIDQHDELSKIYHKQSESFVLCTLHYGNWELIAVLMNRLGVSLTCLAERILNPWADKFIQTIRKNSGVKIVYNEISKMRPLLSVIKKKEGGVALLADQAYWFDPAFIPFFNKEASVPQGAAGLALKMKADLCCVYTRLVEKGRYILNMDADFNLVKYRDMFLNKEELMKIIYKKYEEIISIDIKEWAFLSVDRWGLTRESLKEWEKNPDGCRF